ncbi:hypothetical protein NIL07_26270, partial [Klebsiella pneumoniae]
MQKKTDESLAGPPIRETPSKGSSPLQRLRRFKPQRKFVLTALLALVGPVVAAAIGLYLYMAGGRFISTDNAYVKADKIAVSADISGRVR